MGSGPAGRYRRVQLPRGSVPAGSDSSVPRDGTTTRRAPGTTWTSRGVSPITSPSPWTGMGRSVWMATVRLAVKYWMFRSSRCRPRTTFHPTLR